MVADPIELVPGLSPDQRREVDALLGVIEESVIQIRKLVGPGYRRVLNAAGFDPPGSS